MRMKTRMVLLTALVLAALACSIAAAQEVTINEIGDVAVGETVVINGTTNIEPGNSLLVNIAAIGFAPSNASAPGGVEGTSGTAIVEEGDATANIWSFEADTTGFEPGEYIVTVEWVEGDAVASATFNITEGETATPGETETSPAATPTTPATATTEPSPTPTAAGPAAPFAAVFAAAAFGYLLKRR